MRTLRRTLMLIMLVLLAPTSALADAPDNVLQYLQIMRKEGTLDLFMGIAGDSYGWANAANETKHLQPLYCPPGNLAITNNQYTKIFEGYITRHPQWANDRPERWNYVLLNALIETFPCK